MEILSYVFVMVSIGLMFIISRNTIRQVNNLKKNIRSTLELEKKKLLDKKNELASLKESFIPLAHENEALELQLEALKLNHEAQLKELARRLENELSILVGNQETTSEEVKISKELVNEIRNKLLQS